MKILVLDDQEIIRSKPASHYVDAHDYTKDEFEQFDDVQLFLDRLYDDVYWDEVWIDHDLGNKFGVQFSNGKHATYEILVNANEEYPILPDVGMFRIISANAAVQGGMCSDIQMAGLQCEITPMYIMGSWGISRGDYLANTKKVEK